MAIAIACSAILAASPMASMCAMRLSAMPASMASVAAEPGSARAAQSKRSKGTNGRPASFHPTYDTETKTAVNNAATTTPSRNRKLMVGCAGMSLMVHPTELSCKWNLARR